MAKILKQIIILFAVLTIFAMAVHSAPSDEKCGANEEFTTCGTACPLTCEKRTPGACTFNCHIGCQCKEGHLKNAAGQCVAEKDC